MRWRLASTFAFGLMSAACYEEGTFLCPDGVVLCPVGSECTGNTPASGKQLCGDPREVAQCANVDRVLCTRAESADAGADRGGTCIDKLCAPCTPELAECRYSDWTSMGASPATELESVWVEAATRAFAVGVAQDIGRVYEYDGSRWTEQALIPGAMRLNAVWSRDAHVYAVGNDGIVYRDGTAFTASTPLTSLRGVSGESATNLVVVGARQIVGEFDGTTWTWTTGSSLQNLNDVFNIGDTFFVAGSAGEVRRRVGGIWTALPTIPNVDLDGIWAVSADDVFVVGVTTDLSASGVIYRLVAGAWEPQQLPAGTPRLFAVWGASSNEVFAVGGGGTILRFDGTTWSATAVAAQRLVDISGVARDAIAVGADGSLWRVSPP